MTELSLGENRLSGELPKELGQLENLVRVYLNNNMFTGQIACRDDTYAEFEFLELAE
ncbi:MAG: hypothetical protein V8R91_16490 [Butyricimonas faecihominis]